MKKKTAQSTEAVKVKSRNEKFAKKISTRITEETPCKTNAFLAKSKRIHGFDIVELMKCVSFTDCLYLLFRGELPTSAQSRLFEALAVILIDLGPRHTASRAAINAVIGKTANTHVVPVAAMALVGDYNGANEVENAMRFIKASAELDPVSLAYDCHRKSSNAPQADQIIAPGFGTDYGGQSPLLLEQWNYLASIRVSKKFRNWSASFSAALSQLDCGGWRLAGVVSAVLLDLGFEPREGASIFQLLSLPGAAAHGLSFSGRPLTDVPFLDDQHYVINS